MLMLRMLQHLLLRKQHAARLATFLKMLHVLVLLLLLLVLLLVLLPPVLSCPQHKQHVHRNGKTMEIYFPLFFHHNKLLTKSLF